MNDNVELSPNVESVISPQAALPTRPKVSFLNSDNDDGRKEERVDDSDTQVKDANSNGTTAASSTKCANGNATIHNPGDHAEHDVQEVDDDLEPADNVGGTKAKKKKKRKPKSQRGLKAPSGFEEYYVDAPLTPEQHQEEVGLYDPSRHFEHRIEIAIQRYTARRKLDTERSVLFDKYLVYGGIRGGVKMFSGGLDPNTLADSTAAEIAMMNAKYTVPFGASDELSKSYVVDFEGCLRGFLSTHFPANFDISGQGSVERYVGVIRNFLNYLLHHDVCPEYQSQIENAKAFCNKAETELRQIVETQPLFPGSFNQACSVLFGGIFHTSSSLPSSWTDERDSLGSMAPTQAAQVFKIGLAAYGSDKQLADYQSQRKQNILQIVQSQELCLEIVDIETGLSVPDVVTLYNNEGKDLPRLGKLVTKAWKHPTAMEDDLTLEEEQAKDETEEGLATQPALYEFWIDDNILEKLVKGMKFTTIAKKLSFGIWYFDAPDTLLASFFTLLPNDLMLGWRKIEEAWLAPRPKHAANKEAGNEEEVDHQVEKEP